MKHYLALNLVKHALSICFTCILYVSNEHNTKKHHVELLLKCLCLMFNVFCVSYFCLAKPFFLPVSIKNKNSKKLEWSWKINKFGLSFQTQLLEKRPTSNNYSKACLNGGDQLSKDFSFWLILPFRKVSMTVTSKY